jgi:Zn-dependent M32 family carboxypeptidase
MTDPLPDDDPLTLLRERIRATQEAASALAADAEASMREGGTGGRVPRQGYSSAAEGQAQTDDDLRALLGVLETLRALVPAELQQQVSDVIRQVLLLLRALIDWWVARLEAPQERPGVAQPPRAQDIPIA